MRTDAATGGSAASMPGPLEAWKDAQDRAWWDGCVGWGEEPEREWVCEPWREHEHGEY